MRDWAMGIAAGAVVAVILAGAVVGALDLWGPAAHGAVPPPKPRPPAVARIGPDGSDRTFFGDDVRNAIVPGSQKYDLCVGELRVQRPSMMTSDMPDAFCTVTRQSRMGPWRIGTGGWQQCQAVCIKLRS